MEQAKEHQMTSHAHPVLNIIGGKVALGPIRQDLVPFYHRWSNDFAVLRTLHIPRPSSLEEVQAAYETQVAEERQRRIVYFTIYDRATCCPIGRAHLGDINYRDRGADFGVEIGEATYRGRGYGTEATRLTLDYAFTALGLHNVALETWDYNRAAQRAYTKVSIAVHN